MIDALVFLAAVSVLKVEPPNWWANHSINPVRLLIRGTDLEGARITGDRWLAASNVNVNAAGTYAFVDVTIRRGTPAGPHPLQLSTARGAATVPFDISPPLPRAGRFQGFGPDDLIYLLMPDRFVNGDPSNDDPPQSPGLLDKSKARYYHGGDLQGVIDRLPYLKDLGVTAIWLNPVYDNVNQLNRKETYDGQPITDYHGYGAVDFYAVDEHLGTLAKFRELVDAAHAAGIKVIQDQVANHTGPYHPWVADSPTPTWYYGTADSHLANTWQTWTLHDPHATPALQKQTLEGWFIDILPDLNQDDAEVARYLLQNTLWWIGVSGIDGIRQDTLPYVHRRFWRDWTAAIRREYPQFRVVGELFDADPVLVSFFQGGRARYDGIDSGVDSVFDFPLFYPVRRAFAEGRSIREIPAMLARDHLYVRPELLVTFLGLHDVPRFMNEQGADLAGLKLAWTFLLTARGTPMIYYGDEIGMPGGGDPDNRRDFPAGAFTPEQAGLHAHVRALARLRAATPDLRTGKHTSLYADEQVYVYSRGAAVVALNNGKAPAEVEVPAGLTVAGDALGACEAPRREGSVLRVRIPARMGCVFR